MSKKTRLELIQVPYARLLKLELQLYVNSIINIVESYEPKSLKIDGTFDLLLAEKPQLDKLVVKYRAHPLTKKVTSLRTTRTVYLGSISNRLKVVEREDETGMDDTVNLVKVEISRFLEKLNSCKSEQERCQKIISFFETIDKDEVLEDAFTSLKFSEHLDNLRSVHSTIMELTATIVKSKSKRPTEKTNDLKRSVILATEDFFKELLIAPLLNKDLDYKPLYDELNKLTTKYRNTINNRILFNKRKAESKNESVTEETGETVETTETTNSSTIPQPLALRTFQEDSEELNNNGSSNGFGVKALENEKAVATSSKLQQPPSLINKD